MFCLMMWAEFHIISSGHNWVCVSRMTNTQKLTQTFQWVILLNSVVYLLAMCRVHFTSGCVLKTESIQVLIRYMNLLTIMSVCDHEQFCTMQKLNSYLIYEVSGSVLFHFTWISWRMKWWHWSKLLFVFIWLWPANYHSILTLHSSQRCVISLTR